MVVWVHHRVNQIIYKMSLAYMMNDWYAKTEQKTEKNKQTKNRKKLKKAKTIVPHDKEVKNKNFKIQESNIHSLISRLNIF